MFEMGVLHKLLPPGARALVLSMFRKPMNIYLKQVERGIPKFRLSEKHLAHARLLASRGDLLQVLPKHAIVAELGVDTGDFSAEILATCKPQKLHLVDFWGSKRYNQNKKESVFARFQAQREADMVQIHLGLSTDVASEFTDAYFDWIYIDTDHTYATTYAELNLYAPKVKPGGIIAGHDYSIGNWTEMRRYGVIEAVHRFCREQDWEIVWLTMESDFPQSFAIRNMQSSDLI